MRQGEDESEGGVAVDPICGRPVLEDESEEASYKERTYYFCSDGCRKRFEQRAERIHVGELARSGALFGDQRIGWGVA